LSFSTKSSSVAKLPHAWKASLSLPKNTNIGVDMEDAAATEVEGASFSLFFHLISLVAPALMWPDFLLPFLFRSGI